MPIPRVLPVILGATATLATTAILVLHIILAHALSSVSHSVRTAALLSSVLEALILVSLAWLLSSYVGLRGLGGHGANFGNIWFASSLLLCAITAAASVATVICLSNASSTILPGRILGSTTTGFLVGSSVALGISFATQLVFLVVHYIIGRMHCHEASSGLETEEDPCRPPQPQAKSVLYHQADSRLPKAQGSTSMDSRSPPGSSAGRSASETMSSIRSSLSHVVRPISSKTRLLSGSQRSSRRPTSIDSNAYRDRSSMTEDGFDSWDTSAVDPQNRQTVLETTSSTTPARFLETIPASPATSRSPSPGTPLDLEAPRTRKRSRSYSPASQCSRYSQRAAFTHQSNASEAHIHPLFRSDSPTPPPSATPGTVVTAAPNAGQVISDRQSIQTLRRMRSDSLPVVRSPLSQHGSLDDLKTRSERAASHSPEPTQEMEGLGSESERKMTPPIPDWILSAGSRMSLSGYHSRKLRSAGA
ncbi:hypothetical protein QBC33DRAFT_341165 [Phialemonium atrogriseum]|uniref:Uncharacterized protein n=1 Tax=Phialemonium atrogriseum TaxID=1093897 RepID=A0AAJ0C5H4_9PEZI|nr:uncharacterized protein QBC33DRAFT_341165 [Phialemonium atrogriseum]KAK1769084.1 hypothetical protein QBC33DRAFT_341165 [Phialemonium atrogriseum]